MGQRGTDKGSMRREGNKSGKLDTIKNGSNMSKTKTKTKSEQANNSKSLEFCRNELLPIISEQFSILKFIPVWPGLTWSPKFILPKAC